jgi:hypothetical protein
MIMILSVFCAIIKPMTLNITQSRVNVLRALILMLWSVIKNMFLPDGQCRVRLNILATKFIEKDDKYITGRTFIVYTEL